MYEIFSTDNSYSKAKRLIRAIAVVNPEGVWLIKADFDAMFLDLLEAAGRVTVAEMHKESNEAMQAELEDKPINERIRELRESIATQMRRLNDLETLGFSPADEVAQHRQKQKGSAR